MKKKWEKPVLEVLEIKRTMKHIDWPPFPGDECGDS
jgi:hypothetical protein